MSNYNPEFKGAIEGYIVNFLRKNHWRVASTMTWEDAQQEAYVVFLKLAKKHPVIDTAAHFMALFKTSLARRFHDLSTIDTKRRVEVPMQATHHGEDSDSDVPVMGFDQVGELDCDGALVLLIEQAPPEVKAVIHLFLNAPQAQLEKALEGWREDKKNKDGGSARICQLLGLPRDMDVLGMTRQYFLH